MLAGKRAFQGDDASDTLATVLKSEPAWSALPLEVPPAIRMLIRRCLEKDRNRRVTDISTAVFLIKEPSALAPVPSGTNAPYVAARRSRERLGWLVAGVLLLVGALSVPFAVVHFREPTPDNHPIRFVILAPDRGSVSGTPPSISPDGRRLAFVATLDGKTQLWIRSIESATAQPLVGTDGADFPFWSPDSRFIGFFADGKLRKIDASGGPPQTLCDAPAGRGGAWSRDGVIIFAPAATGPIHRVSSSGGPRHR